MQSPTLAKHRSLPHTDESVIDYPAQGKVFLRRLAVLPFEAAIAIASIWGGMSSLFGLTTGGQAFGASLPPGMVTLFNLLYILSGLAIMLGLGWGYRNLEACGLILLITSLLVRSLTVTVTFGATPLVIATVAQAVIFGTATILRLIAVFKNGTIVQVNGPVKLE